MNAYICPFCQSVVVIESTPYTLDFRGVSLVINGPSQCRCSKCGATFVPRDMLRANTRFVADAKRARLGMLSGEQIESIRTKVLGLSRFAASQRFGLGRNAFYKYEEEGKLQSKPTDNLLRALDHSPAALEALSEPGAAKRAVALKENVSQRLGVPVIVITDHTYDLSLDFSTSLLHQYSGKPLRSDHIGSTRADPISPRGVRTKDSKCLFN